MTCSLCGASTGHIHLHHPTGRHAGTPYHPNWTRPLCPECHTKLHRVWHFACLDMRRPGPVLLLRRAAFDLGQRPYGLAPADAMATAHVLDDIAYQLRELGK